MKSPRGRFRRIAILTKIAWALIAFGVVAFAYGYSAFVGKLWLTDIDRNDLALLGNFLQGAVASVWSLAAFIFIYVAFLGQQRQLDETREQLAQQDSVARQQRFENSFFELLRLHNSLVEQITMQDFNGQTVHGRGCFRIIHNRLAQSFQAFAASPWPEMQKIEQAYTDFYRSHQAEIGHYFRNIYHVIRFVDTNSPEPKSQYSKLVRAQLSSAELLLLFYNALSSFGRDKFKPLIEEYALLEQVPTQQLFRPDHRDLYSGSAFQD